jgi:hypothetical protein
MKRKLSMLGLAALISVPPVFAAQAAPRRQDDLDLTPIKEYAQAQSAVMKENTTTLTAIAGRYYQLAEEAEFDYEAMWEANQAEFSGMLPVAQEAWLAASSAYELQEGIIAGVPSLAYYDTWIDAGPSGEEAPDEALEWTLELPDGTTIESPGNIFSYVTEPALYGTIREYVGLEVDLDGDGEIELGEVLPEANIFLGGLTALDGATDEMIEAVDAWEPTLEDAFTALVVMLPTMSEYFGQWKDSVFVSGEESTQPYFVAVSRLSDIIGIVNGLELTYGVLAPEVEAVNPDLHAQILAGFEDLVPYLNDIYAQEQEGTVFTAEEADLYGTEAQSKAEALAALCAQAAVELGLELELE